MVQMVDSQQEELSVEDIVDIAAMNGDTAVIGGAAMESIAIELQMPNTLFLRQGNTLFIMHKAEPGVAWFRAINADTAKNYIQNGKTFIDACYRMGFDTVATKFTDPTLLGLFRAISRDPPREGMGYNVRRTTKDEYFVTVKTGPERRA